MDTILVLSRDRLEQDGLLKVTGRDIAEGEYAFTLTERRWWRFKGADLAEASAAVSAVRAAAGLGDRQAALIDYVSKHPAGIRAADVATDFDMDQATARTYLNRLASAGRISNPSRGLYTPVASVASVAWQIPSLADDRNTRNTRNAPRGVAEVFEV